jgi:hypothetical protein
MTEKHVGEGMKDADHARDVVEVTRVSRDSLQVDDCVPEWRPGDCCCRNSIVEKKSRSLRAEDVAT